MIEFNQIRNKLFRRLRYYVGGKTTMEVRYDPSVYVRLRIQSQTWAQIYYQVNNQASTLEHIWKNVFDDNVWYEVGDEVWDQSKEAAEE